MVERMAKKKTNFFASLKNLKSISSGNKRHRINSPFFELNPVWVTTAKTDSLIMVFVYRQTDPENK